MPMQDTWSKSTETEINGSQEAQLIKNKLSVSSRSIFIGMSLHRTFFLFMTSLPLFRILCTVVNIFSHPYFSVVSPVNFSNIIASNFKLNGSISVIFLGRISVIL